MAKVKDLEQNGFSKANDQYATDVDDEPVGCGNIIRAWPKTTLAIIGNEFCERFSYYGMRTVLTLYLLNIVGLTDDTSTVVFHGFTVLAYTSPFLGSILADGYFGKFKTILWISILYTIGQVVLSVSATFPKGAWVHPYIDLLGLIIIACGTGGIKPCVAPFGADQFEVGQERLISMYFSMFYFSINAGSTISTFLTPVLRSLPCFGQQSCYPLAFGVPALLMVVATIIFLLGSFRYKKMPPTENVFVKVIAAIKTALVNKSRSTSKRDHWLDHYCDTNPTPEAQQFADDIKAVLRVIVMFLPVPMFWALFDQQGSRWIIQGVAMDGDLGFYNLLPDQMLVMNALLIMLFIPIFQGIIYPLVTKIGVELTPLRKMAAGGFLTALAYFICGFIQLKVNATLPELPMEGIAHIQFVNGYPDCDLTFTQGDRKITVGSLAGSPVSPRVNGYDFSAASTTPWTVTGCKRPTEQLTFATKEMTTYVVPITEQPFSAANQLLTISNDKLVKPTKGQGESAIKFGYLGGVENMNGTLMFCKLTDDTDPEHPCDPQDVFGFESVELDAKTYGDHRDDIVLKPGTWVIYKLAANEAIKTGDDPNPKKDINPIEIHKNSTFTFSGQGGVYAVTLTKDSCVRTELAETNTVSILLQLPQYVTITAAEIMFSITGLDFSYSQAPTSMKSVVQALWLFAVGIGNFIIIIVAETRPFTNLAYEMFFYGGLMVVVMIIFSLLAMFYYEYHYYTRQPQQKTKKPINQTAPQDERLKF